MNEVWKDVPGYEGRYQVSDLGRVKSLPNQQRKTEAVMKLAVKSNGYVSVCLTDAHKGSRRQRDHWVHSLVLEAFVGFCPSGMECCHGDGNRSNNRLGNLRWGTKKSNAEDKRKHGTMAIGSRNGQSKLSEQNVVRIRELIAAGDTQASIARAFNVSPGLISQIATNRAWNHV